MPISAGAAASSFFFLPLEDGPQCTDLMALAECKKALLLRGAKRDIAFEHAFDGLRGIFRFDVAINLTAKHGVGTEATADQNMITFDCVALVGRLHLAGEQSNFANVMLSTRMMTARQMNIDRRVELHPRFAPARDLVRVSLGVGSGELASDVAGTSN